MPRLRLCTALAVSLFALAACDQTTHVGASRTLKLGLTEYRIVPQHVRAHAGELSILAHNYGRLTHNLVITSSGHPLASTKPIAPGASAWLVVELVPGSYTMASNLLSDQALGAYGTLTVSR